jgi:hypothetical protein
MLKIKHIFTTVLLLAALNADADGQSQAVTIAQDNLTGSISSTVSLNK